MKQVRDCWECGEQAQEGVPLVRCSQCQQFLLCGRLSHVVNGVDEGPCTMGFHLPFCTAQLRYTERVARQVLKRLTDAGVVGTLAAVQTVAMDELIKGLLFKLKEKEVPERAWQK